MKNACSLPRFFTCVSAKKNVWSVKNDGMIRKCLVEHVAGQQLPRRHQVLVVAVPDDQFTRLHSLCLVKLLQHGHDLRSVVRRSRRGGGNIRPVGHRERVDEVAVGIDEPGQQRLAREFDERGGIAVVGRLDFTARADAHDPAILDRKRFRRWLGVVDGNDFAADIDHVGRNCGRHSRGRSDAG
jgi:hypothetical protein